MWAWVSLDPFGTGHDAIAAAGTLEHPQPLAGDDLAALRGYRQLLVESGKRCELRRYDLAGIEDVINPEEE